MPSGGFSDFLLLFSNLRIALLSYTISNCQEQFLIPIIRFHCIRLLLLGRTTSLVSRDWESLWKFLLFIPLYLFSSSFLILFYFIFLSLESKAFINIQGKKHNKKKPWSSPSASWGQRPASDDLPDGLLAKHPPRGRIPKSFIPAYSEKAPSSPARGSGEDDHG